MFFECSSEAFGLDLYTLKMLIMFNLSGNDVNTMKFKKVQFLKWIVW